MEKGAENNAGVLFDRLQVLQFHKTDGGPWPRDAVQVAYKTLPVVSFKSSGVKRHGSVTSARQLGGQWCPMSVCEGVGCRSCLCVR